MPDVVVDQQETAGLQAARDLRHQRLVRALGLVVAARNHAGGAAFQRGGLRHVHDHRPAAAMVPHAAEIAPVAVPVDALRLGTRQVVVQRAMRVHRIVRTDDAGQRAADHGIRKHLIQLRDCGQKVITRVEVGAVTDQRIEAFPNAAMERIRQLGAQAEIAMRDKMLHLRVGQQFRRGHEWGLQLGACWKGSASSS